MRPALSALSDDELRARLWRAADQRMDASTTRARHHAGTACLEVVGELTRRRAPLRSSAGERGSGAGVP